MPFDAAPSIQSRKRRLSIAARQDRAMHAVEIIDTVIRVYETGAWPWKQGWCNVNRPESGICASFALSKVSARYRREGKPAHYYMARVIRNGKRILDASCTVIDYNDKEGRTFEEVMDALRNARSLAKMEAWDAV
jgi:hypothetical protein